MPFPQTNPALQRALAERNYDQPTQVQEAVLQAGAAGRDLLVSAQTGSGKTVAFGLAFAPLLLGEAEVLPRAAAPLALVIAPTRELAIQVQGELAWLYGAAGARIECCVGGMDARREQRALAAGCHILVGTPGRLRDHLERDQLKLDGLRVVVLDEADEMLDMGFREDLEFILDATPKDRRTMLFSATLAKEIVSLARRYQRDALRIDTIDRHTPHADIDYRAMRISNGEAARAVVNILRFFAPPAALVFCATRESVKALHIALVERGFSAVTLSGELSQAERNTALAALREGRARVCVATDVAARGLDLPELALVVHADLPVDRAALLHRSGRTGRAGHKGMSVLLVPYTARRRAEALLTAAGVTAVWSDPPGASEIIAQDQARLAESLAATADAGEGERAAAAALLAAQGGEAVAIALLRLYQASLPAPEVFSRTPAHAPEASASRPARASGEMIWFTLAVGRRENADPKWLVPLICRRGGVTKQDIGTIRIGEAETHFEITAAAAEGFAGAVRRGGDEPRIAPAGAGAGPSVKRVVRRPQARKSGARRT